MRSRIKDRSRGASRKGGHMSRFGMFLLTIGMLTLLAACYFGSTAPPFTIGGTVSGLSGSVVLQNNRGEDLTVNADGTFTFATGLSGGDVYSVTVLTHPSGAFCTVADASGTVIASVVIGGTLLTGGSGRVIGTFFGVLIYGLVFKLPAYISAFREWWAQILVGVLVLVFILIQTVITQRTGTISDSGG